MVPHLDRLAASLLCIGAIRSRAIHNFQISAWFAALNERPAYDRVKTDAATINLLYADYGVLNRSEIFAVRSCRGDTIQHRAETAERLSDNREAAIVTFSKLWALALAVNGDISAVKDAISFISSKLLTRC